MFDWEGGRGGKGHLEDLEPFSSSESKMLQARFGAHL